MKFDKKYPDKVNAQKLFPDKLMGPHKEIAVTALLTQSWRVYPCAVCRAPTGWRFTIDDLPAAACSEECVDELKKNSEESCAAPPAKAS